MDSPPAVFVADCERVQTNWFRMRAAALGGEVWTDGGMPFTEGPDGLNLMFPTSIDADAVARGVARARAHGLSIVGAWLSLDVDTTALADAGFEEGWSPWWMTAALSDVPDDTDPRVRLEPQLVIDGRDPLTLPAGIWHAVARVGDPPVGVGGAWSFLDDSVDEPVAGIFDMGVDERIQRQGLGTSLLAAVCAAARDSGARHAVLNATPDGKSLYDTCGFMQIGEGITWWNHLR